MPGCFTHGQGVYSGGGVEGISHESNDCPPKAFRVCVAGDIIRRLVSRTIAQQIRKKVEKATAELSTRAGECIAHAIQAMTDANPQCSVLSVDGTGGYDTISRRASVEWGWSGTWKVVTMFCRLCSNSTDHRLLICGRILKVWFTKCCKEREETRATVSCGDSRPVGA